jgi:DNA-binding protein HU-beta
MTKAELIKVVAKEVEETQIVTEKVVNAFLKALESTVLEEGKVFLPKFGTFKLNVSKERLGRNPATGAPVNIPSKKSIKFKQS